MSEATKQEGFYERLDRKEREQRDERMRVLAAGPPMGRNYQGCVNDPNMKYIPPRSAPVEPESAEPQVDWTNDEAVVRAALTNVTVLPYGHPYNGINFHAGKTMCWLGENWHDARKYDAVQLYERQHNPAYAQPASPATSEPAREAMPARPQATVCACCLENKATPLRRDEMYGYVCLQCVEVRLDGVVTLEAKVAALEAEQKADSHTRERERTTLAAAVQGIDQGMAPHMWLVTSRGSYAWDDDRYREEFGAAMEKVTAAIAPLRRIAVDWSRSPKTAAEVESARMDWKARAENAEAENARLREFLSGIAAESSFGGGPNAQKISAAWHQAIADARRYLAAKASKTSAGAKEESNDRSA